MVDSDKEGKSCGLLEGIIDLDSYSWKIGSCVDKAGEGWRDLGLG